MQTIIQGYALAGSIIGIYMLILFFVSLYKKDNSIVDVAYGIGFVLVAWSTLIYFTAYSFVPLLLSSVITVWGLRLSVRIYKRNKGKPEDFRYKKWRDTWVWFKTRSFFQIYVLQGAIILAISAVSIITNATFNTAPQSFTALQGVFVIAGICIWAIGFYFEAIGDYQLDRFIKGQKEAQAKGEVPTTTIMMTGLWSLTRHPNYFGEVSMWWGLWIITLVGPFGIYAIVSPLVITYLLLKVSGIPMLEKKYEGNQEYMAYQQKTNAFFPWKQKK